MIQDIAPHTYHNEYKPSAPDKNSFILAYEKGSILLPHQEREADIYFPRFQDLDEKVSDLYSKYIYLFSIDDQRFYLIPELDTTLLPDYEFQDIRNLRTARPQHLAFAGVTGHQLFLEFPDFVQYIKEVCEEFRTLYDNIQGTTPYCVKRVAVLNCWGKMRSWGNHMVHHAIYYKQNYSYFGIIEALSGAPFDVSFISFDDIKADKDILKKFDVVINVGDADTAQSGGENWIDETIITAVREFVYNGGGFIGVGEPAAHQWQGRFIQLDDVLGVEEEHGFNLNTDKYNWEEHRDHFILKDAEGEVDFGEGKKNIYALPETEILIQKDQEVQMAVKTFGKGRGVYISGLPYSFKNSRVLYRAVLWSASAEEELHCWYSTNYNVEVHAYVKNGKYCVVNNTYEPQDTVVYRGDGSSFRLHMEANEIKWYQI